LATKCVLVAPSLNWMAASDIKLDGAFEASSSASLPTQVKYLLWIFPQGLSKGGTDALCLPTCLK
jgi:hypothetical protein